jgi:hypothetical protein
MLYAKGQRLIMYGLHPQGIHNVILCLLDLYLLPWQFSPLLTLLYTQHKFEDKSRAAANQAV